MLQRWQLWNCTLRQDSLYTQQMEIARLLGGVPAQYRQLSLKYLHFPLSANFFVFVVYRTMVPLAKPFAPLFF